MECMENSYECGKYVEHLCEIIQELYPLFEYNKISMRYYGNDMKKKSLHYMKEKICIPIYVQNLIFT